ncbi:2-phospho-L-lactate transferase [Actinokineospora cianjurensis]|uniref:LPPG:FO 2-phospho-L-lactate transferase n=1 Tax=Actinokineospora cianjurensis TaxID=585224 RepID=A0A421B9U5_9PSEU|nr:2-phospho-L-lactate transferase [Actinokineospora cianjurensis]RLK61055.1 LPPG:FO 2-phospho-L-lactate transferase [Actinokineospora cianjurensis]
MKVVVVVGGVGGARFLLGVKKFLGLPPVGAPEVPSAHEVTAIVNTADDIWLHGLRICPDLDSCMYTLGGGSDTERGWGRTGESWTVKEELAAYGAEPEWFGLGDKDIATHLVRTRMMRAGYELSDITAALSDRWKPGVRLLPMTDDRVETHVVIDEPSTGERKAVHFQEWWVRYRAEPRARSIVPVGADESTPAPGVVEAITDADIVLLAPSNPVVSVGTVLAVPGVRTALRKTEAPVVGVSPIIGGKPVRGMADACLEAIGLASSAEAVGRHYGSRACSESGVLDGWLVATGDTADVPGVAVRAVPLLMSDVDATAAMVLAAMELGGVDVG